MTDMTKRRTFLNTALSIFVGFAALLGGAVYAQNEGDKYVLDSLKMLLTANTIECDILLETYVDGKEYTARGRYEEQALPKNAPDSFLRSMYRLEINFPMNTSTANDSEPNRMTLVCSPSETPDKNLITQYSFIEGTQEFSTIDLTRLERRLQSASNKKAVFAQISEVRHLGGLAGTLRQISRFYEFSAPTQDKLQDEETVATWKLTGTLRSIYHTDLLKQFGGLDKNGHYPADFPSDIEVWLGRHNDFPYKIRFLRRTSEKTSQKKPLFQESFYKVNVNGPPIPASKFAPLTPPDGILRVQDETANVLKTLGL